MCSDPNVTTWKAGSERRDDFGNHHRVTHTHDSSISFLSPPQDTASYFDYINEAGLSPRSELRKRLQYQTTKRREQTVPLPPDVCAQMQILYPKVLLFVCVAHLLGE